MSAKKVLVRNEDGNTSLVNSQSGSGAATGATAADGTGASGATQPAFTGATPTTATDEALAGTGFATAGQTVTTTAKFIAARDEFKGMWLITATQPPCLIHSNDATIGALGSHLVMSVFGAAPPTSAEAFKILRAPAPAGSVASHTHTGPSHTHAAGTLAGPAHTHTITSP